VSDRPVWLWVGAAIAAALIAFGIVAPRFFPVELPARFDAASPTALEARDTLVAIDAAARTGDVPRLRTLCTDAHFAELERAIEALGGELTPLRLETQLGFVGDLGRARFVAGRGAGARAAVVWAFASAEEEPGRPAPPSLVGFVLVHDGAQFRLDGRRVRRLVEGDEEALVGAGWAAELLH
jgi:hypothetical protein